MTPFMQQWTQAEDELFDEVDRAFLAALRAQGYILPGAVIVSREVPRGSLRRCDTCDAARGIVGPLDELNESWCARADDWTEAMPDDSGIYEDCPIWQPLVLIRCSRCRNLTESSDACLCAWHMGASQ